MKKFALALAAAAIALGATAAHATVTHGQFATSPKASALTIAGDKGAITFAAGAGLFGYSSGLDATATGAFEIGSDVVAEGSVIDAATAMSKGTDLLDWTALGGLFSSNKVLGTDLLLPFEFTTTAGKTDYGWIEFDASKVTSKLKTTYSFTLDQFAYTDNPQGIRAGTLSAVPEPASAVLMLAGALGLVGFRRRRQLQG